MVKAERRWLVRNESGTYRVIKRMRPPHKPASGWENWRGRLRYPCQLCVDILLPKRFNLKPGGGPLELPG